MQVPQPQAGLGQLGPLLGVKQLQQVLTVKSIQRQIGKRQLFEDRAGALLLGGDSAVVARLQQVAEMVDQALALIGLRL